jgi:hypothetical protein
MVGMSAAVRSRLSILFAVHMVQASSALAQPLEPELADVEALPAHIATVVTGGEWQVGEEHGFYRIVVTASGIEHVSNRIYLQRLALDFTQNGYRLVETRGVEELNGLGVAASVAADFYCEERPVVTISTTDRSAVTASP